MIMTFMLVNLNSIGLEQTPGISYWDHAPDLPRLIGLVTLNMKQLLWLLNLLCKELQDH